MSNDMKKFFADNREAFDDKTPSQRNWSRIEWALFGERSGNVWHSVTLWRAAAVVFLGLSLIQFFGNRAASLVEQDRLSQQEFSDVESYYSAQISEKVLLIRNDEYFTDDQFTQDIEKLEAMYAVLAEDLKKRPSAKVKDALVLNMLVRIDLLNQQIQKLEDSRQKEKPKAEV